MRSRDKTIYTWHENLNYLGVGGRERRTIGRERE